VATNSGIVRFNNALSATGNIAPAATITGAATTLSAPQHLLVDPTGDRLFVANAGASSILVFDSASTINGNVAPTRTISGTATLLAAPHDLAIDPTSNLLYVADGTQILVFQSASTTNGNIPPVHNIGMGFAVGAMVLDITNDRLYVADSSGNTIDRLEGASLQNGPAVVAASIAGTSTGLAQPGGLAFDAAGRLIVANTATPSITIFGSAAAATGNIAPSATVSGAGTHLAGPDQIVLNSASTNGELFVADNLAGAILIFDNFNTINGATPPQRTIGGSSTTLVANGVNGVALDPAR
jgi:DNA-binding beta-propeller fold protein YncE